MKTIKKAFETIWTAIETVVLILVIVAWSITFANVTVGLVVWSTQWVASLI